MNSCCKKEEGKYCTECGQANWTVAFRCKAKMCVIQVGPGELYCDTHFAVLVGLKDVWVHFGYAEKEVMFAGDTYKALRAKFSESFLETVVNEAPARSGSRFGRLVEGAVRRQEIERLEKENERLRKANDKLKDSNVQLSVKNWDLRSLILKVKETVS